MVWFWKRGNPDSICQRAFSSIVYFDQRLPLDPKQYARLLQIEPEGFETGAWRQ